MKFDYPIDDEKLKVSQIRGARPSPDGKRVVFTALDRLWIADLPPGRGTKKEKPAVPAATRTRSRTPTRRQVRGRRGHAQKPAAERRQSRRPTRRRHRPPRSATRGA